MHSVVTPPAVMAGAGPPGAPGANGATAPPSSGNPVFQALLAMLLGTPHPTAPAAGPAPVPAEAAAPPSAAPERAPATDPVRASLADLASPWLPIVAPSAAASLSAPAPAGGTATPRSATPPVTPSLPSTATPDQFGPTAPVARDSSWPTTTTHTLALPARAPAPLAPPDAASRPTVPVRLDQATPPMPLPAAGPDPAPGALSIPAIPTADPASPTAATRSARPAPSALPGHHVVATAPEPGAAGHPTDPLVVSRPAGGEEERPAQPVQHDLAAAGEAPIRPAPTPEGTAAARPADDRPPAPLSAEAVETIVHQTRLTRTPGHTSLRLHLRPAELGEVQVTIDVSARGAAIHVTASTPDGQAAVERGLPALRGALASAGLDPDRLTLTTGTGSPSVAGGPSFDFSHQGRSWQEHTPPRFVVTSAPAVAGARTEEPAPPSHAVPRDSQLDIRI